MCIIIYQRLWNNVLKPVKLKNNLFAKKLLFLFSFYPRWREYEASQASRMLDFTLEEAQWQDDWESLLATAGQQGSALEQLHVFALCHILRRPIIVYGVKYVKSFRGEDIGGFTLMIITNKNISFRKYPEEMYF